jgi:hypothetical protein
VCGGGSILLCLTFKKDQESVRHSPGLDFLPTFLSMKKVGKKKDRKNSAFLKRTCLTFGYNLSALSSLACHSRKIQSALADRRV